MPESKEQQGRSLLELVLAFVAGGGILGPLVGLLIWHWKRTIQRSSETEDLERKQLVLNIGKNMLDLSEQARANGVSIDFGKEMTDMLKDQGVSHETVDEPSVDELQEALENAFLWGLQNSYTRALLMEGYSGESSDSEDVLNMVRRRFVMEFEELNAMPVDRRILDKLPEERRTLMFTYSEWIQNPSEANHDAYIEAARRLKQAMDDGRIKVVQE